MAADAIVLISISVFWLLVGAGLPFVVPKSNYRGIIIMGLILTAVCCWLFWLCIYLSQMNPLRGPKLNRETIVFMAKYWGNELGQGSQNNSNNSTSG